LNGAFCISTKNFSEDELKQYEELKEEISKLEQKQEKQEKDKNEITALKDKDLFDTSFTELSDPVSSFLSTLRNSSIISSNLFGRTE
jgi:cell shape-determining protein MreC